MQRSPKTHRIKKLLSKHFYISQAVEFLTIFIWLNFEGCGVRVVGRGGRAFLFVLEDRWGLLIAFLNILTFLYFVRCFQSAHLQVLPAIRLFYPLK